jgi:hypothetical protein
MSVFDKITAERMWHELPHRNTLQPSPTMMKMTEPMVKTVIRNGIGATLALAVFGLVGCSSDDSTAEAVESCPAGAECFSFDAVSDVAASGLVVQNGTITVDTSRPRTAGGKSLHLVGSTSYSGRAAVDVRPKSFPRASFHGRAWMYAAQANPAGKNVTLIEAAGKATSPDYQGGAPFDAQFRFGVQNEGPLLRAGYETPGWYATPPTGPHTDCYQHSATKMPVNQWFCATWHIDTTAKQLSFAVDGQPVLQTNEAGEGCVGAAPEPTLGNKWVYPAEIASLTLGWQEYEAGTGTRELWIDDLAVGTEPIPCN